MYLHLFTTIARNAPRLRGGCSATLLSSLTLLSLVNLCSYFYCRSERAPCPLIYRDPHSAFIYEFHTVFGPRYCTSCRRHSAPNATARGRPKSVADDLSLSATIALRHDLVIENSNDIREAERIQHRMTLEGGFKLINES